MDRLWRYLLKISFNKIYGDDKSLNEFIDTVNSETWIGAQIETGGHALRDLKPLVEFEAISIKAVLTGRKSMSDGSIKTEKIDHWNSSWK